MDTEPDIEKMEHMLRKVFISTVYGFFFLLCIGAFSQPTALFEQPLLITSAGQSAEVRVAQVLAKRAGLEARFKQIAERQDLDSIKTLVLVIGVSLKGLGAAGLDKDKERERVSGLLEEARGRNIPLLCLHLGGEARRGQLSDEFITAFLPSARMAIVVRSANTDGLFTRICGENQIPLIDVEKAADALEPLQKAFK